MTESLQLLEEAAAALAREGAVLTYSRDQALVEQAQAAVGVALALTRFAVTRPLEWERAGVG